MTDKKKKAADRGGRPQEKHMTGITNGINPIIPYFDSETAKAFLKTVFLGIENGFIGISYKFAEKDGLPTTAFPVGQTEKIISFIENKTDQELYFSLGVLGKVPARGKRGAVNDVIALPGLWLDIDCKEGSHSATNLPTFEEAKEKLLTAFLEPTVLVHSGGGLHAYWLFPQVISTEAATDREAIKKLSGDFQVTFVKFAKENYGLKVDNTSDLARVLRIPGTVNHKQKDNLKPVTILKQTDKRYTVEELQKAIKGLESQLPRKDPAPVEMSERKAMLAPIVEGCGFMKYCQDNAERLPEPDWYKMLTIVANTEDGPKTAHEWSKKDNRYSYSETETKIQHALTDTGPISCQRIQEDHGTEFCEDCQHFNKIKSPIVIGTEALKEEDKLSAIAAIEAAAEKTKSGDAGAALEPDIINRLIFLEKHFLADYERMTQLLTTVGVKRRSMYSAMRKQRVKHQASQEREGRAPLDDWKIRDNVLYKKKFTEGSFTWKTITRTTPVIDKVLTNDVDGQEHWEIRFKTVRGRNVSVTVPRKKMATKKGLIEELSQYGFDVNESTARDVIDYLRDYDAAHATELPSQHFIDRFGWTNNHQSFVLGNEVIGNEDVIYHPPGDGERQLAEAFRARGTLEEWKKVIDLIKQRKWAMYKLFQSFVPPLLSILEEKGYVFMHSGESSEGKTLTDSIAGSIWGHINYKGGQESLIIQGAGLSLDKIEKVMATMHSLPVFVQDGHKAKQGVIPEAIHQVEMGRARARGHNSAGSLAVRRNKTVLFVTSEAPISSESEDTGLYTRTVQVSGAVIDKKNVLFKEEITEIIFENYGHAGRTFIQYLLTNKEKWPEWRKLHREIVKEAKKEAYDNGITDAKLINKLEFFAVTETAARIARIALDLPLTREEIDEIVAACAYEQLVTTDSSPYYEKAMNALRDWMTVNKTYFFVNGVPAAENLADTRHGIPGLWEQTKNFVAMTRSDVGEILAKRGYDINRCLNEWKNAGYLLTGADGKMTKVTYLPYLKSSHRMLQFSASTFQGE